MEAFFAPQPQTSDLVVDAKYAQLAMLARADRPDIEDDISTRDLEMEIGRFCISEQCKTKTEDIAIRVGATARDTRVDGVVRSNASLIREAAKNVAATKKLFRDYTKSLV